MSNLNYIDVLNSEGKYASLSVGLTAVELKVGASVLDKRQAVTIQPNDNGLYYGFDASVTTTTGTKLFKNQFLMLPIGPDIPVYLIADGAGKSARIGELA